ncbi:MAG: polyribonucleotide nucleotidyltransferase, partial [Candidatus Pacebacteria bacterium]|nr:polyribonucleotide nucleotidyltransferase [Candidatus Paceibacterota bacterium]
MQSKSYTLEVGGKQMVAEFTDLAEQAQGSVILRYGETAVLATAVMSHRTRDDIDYFPLTVDFEERYYAAGAILGSQYMRREGRPSENAILSGRIVDRTIRPLFASHMRNEVQVVVTVLALGEDDPQHLAVNAASLALATSPIPWGGPVAAVRIGDGLKINPTYKERETMALDILACGKDGTINMIEVGAKEVEEDTIAAGFAKAAEEHNKILEWQQQIIKEIGKEKKLADKPELPAALVDLYASEFASRMGAAVFCGAPSKDAIHALEDEWMAKIKENEELAGMKGIAKRYFEDKVDEEIHRGAVEDGKRADNRGMTEVRPLFAKAGGVSPLLHGTGIFYRGGTHVFTALTLGGPGDSLIIDSMEKHDTKQRFMHHYNFPPYSSGETGRMGGINRRATGHGALAQKALEAVLPPAEQFPYTIRLVSECLASNGSTSMGSTCASTIALMDGGVPIKAPVAGIAMGLMLGDNGAYKVLTDIQGPEDEFGDMDFKVAGTRAGVTAIQMDIKLDGIPVSILTEALDGARAARAQILDVIEKEIAAPRASISARAPEILSLKVKPDQIGMVIGGGGKTINGIRDVTAVDDITIEDDGSVYITGRGGSAAKAKAMIEALVKEDKPAEGDDGEVTRLMDFG